MLVLALNLSAQALFCASKFQYQASVNVVPWNWSTPRLWMSVMNIRPTASLALSAMPAWLYCLTKFTRSPPAAMIPMTSGLEEPALVMKVAKFSLGNGVAIFCCTVPPARSTAALNDLVMSWPKA